MRLSRKHKFVLISNWKCGCSTMANLFLPYSDFGYKNQKKCQEMFGIPYGRMVHWPAYKIRAVFKKVGLQWDDYIKITTVRNPWSRIVSLFFYKYGKQKNKTNQQIKNAFTKFVKTELPRWQSGLRNRWISQQMIHDPRTGKKIVNYVVRLEHLEKDLEPIIKKHFPDFKPFDYSMRKNTTQHKHYSFYYTSETRQLVAKMFQWEIRKYKYRFEQPSKTVINEEK